MAAARWRQDAGVLELELGGADPPPAASFTLWPAGPPAHSKAEDRRLPFLSAWLTFIASSPLPPPKPTLAISCRTTLHLGIAKSEIFPVQVDFPPIFFR